MAKTVTTRNGHKVVLRNPSEKAQRFARQLRNGKVTETGKELTATGRAWRAGYLTHSSDSAKAFCHNNGLVSKAKPRKRNKKKQ